MSRYIPQGSNSSRRTSSTSSIVVLREVRVFIIGPMRDNRLRRLKDNVVRPLMDDVQSTNEDIMSYLVESPWDLTEYNIMDRVIERIDRADLIVADITWSNPNVMYELAVCHSLGKPTLVVREQDHPDEQDTHRAPFDISAYRYITINIRDERYQEAVNLLRPALYNEIRFLFNSDIAQNPVTNFYGVPLTQISPAAGLARGYFENFIKPVVSKMTFRAPDQKSYVFRMEVERSDGSWETVGEDIDSRRKMKLIIVVPDHVWLASKHHVDRVKPKFMAARIQSHGRDFTALATEENNQIHLIDVPTTINVMDGSIRSRMHRFGRPDRVQGGEWRRLETQEITRFISEIHELVDGSGSDIREPLRKHLDIRRFFIGDHNPDLRLFHDEWSWPDE